MIFNLYNLSEQDSEKIERLELDHPEIVVTTITAGLDGNTYTELIAHTPDLIQAAGAVIAAIIMAYATIKASKTPPRESTEKE